jgi:hypothetical protein
MEQDISGMGKCLVAKSIGGRGLEREGQAEWKGLWFPALACCQISVCGVSTISEWLIHLNLTYVWLNRMLRPVSTSPDLISLMACAKWFWSIDLSHPTK